MEFKINAYSLQGNQHGFNLNNIPDVCPLCHKSIHPQTVISGFLEERSLVQCIFRCTNNLCQELFIGSYPMRNSQYTLSKTSPKNIINESFPDTINTLSPTFIDIYNQSLAAESQNLTQLVGLGIRKALEFLVKDFAIKNNPSDAVKIKKLPLGKCIDTYMKDSKNIQSCAKRAVWLGNDEAHYTRKWEDKDINDLKLLTKLTVNWIENVLLTEQYINDMDDVKPS